MIPLDWLNYQLSEGEVRGLQLGGRDAAELLVDDATEKSWAKLQSTFLPGDQVWSYVTPYETWEAGAGEKGLLLLRDGVVIASCAGYRSKSGPPPDWLKQFWVRDAKEN